MVRRPLLALLLAILGLALAGCGNKQDVHTLGETEGIYVDVADLSYQIQLSRVLNPNDPEDKAYLDGLPPGTEEPAKDETWFGVFLRVSNPTPEVQKPASSFRIIDTQGQEYEPLVFDSRDNPFAYEPTPLQPRGLIPDPNSVSGEGDIQGSLLLFKVSLASLQNRPLEFEIDSPLPPPLQEKGIVDLDV